MSYGNTADFTAGKTLGVREAPAEPIRSYSFTKLVADPKRAAPLWDRRKQAGRCVD